MSKVSIIIPTYNEADSILSCIDSLKQQTIPIEIIVVDDGSTDDTVKKVRQHQDITLIKQRHLGPGSARNKGAKKARGKILVFVDADMTFDTKYIQKLIEPIIKNKAKGTFAKEELVSNWEQPLARFWNYQQGIATNRRIPPHHPNQAKVFRAILKTEFNRVEGFSPIGYTDDWTLSAKLGYLAQAAPGATCYHHNPDTFVKIWQQAKWIGKRRYKLQILGKLIALCRASLPVSLIIALIKSIKFKKSGFFVFKLYYDLAIFVSIIESFFTSNHAK